MVVVIDGPVGIGKSSLAEVASNRLNFDLQVETHEDVLGLLNRFYETNGEKSCFPMQVNFLANRFSQYRMASVKANVVMDRSIYSDPIFAKMYYDTGKLTFEEYAVYNNLYKEIINTLTPPDLVIHLQCSIQSMIDKIKKRGREQEIQMPDAYWATLHTAYNQYYGNFHYSRVFQLDVSDIDYVNNAEDTLQVIEDIRSIIIDSQR